MTSSRTPLFGAKRARAARTLAPLALTNPEAFLRANGWTKHPHYAGEWNRLDVDLTGWTLAEAARMELGHLAVQELARHGWVVTAGGAATVDGDYYLQVLELRDPIARRYVGSWTAAYARHLARSSAPPPAPRADERLTTASHDEAA